MLPPVLCIGCGKLLGNLYDKYDESVKNDTVAKFFEDNMITNYCCKKTFTTCAKIADELHY